MRKMRTEYQLGNVKIVFDKYLDDLAHIPEFLEIETESLPEIIEFLPKIGFSESDCKTWGVNELIEFYKNS